MLNVLFLLTQDLESPSGLGRYLPLASELTRLGHQVNIAALNADYDALPKRQIETNGISVQYVAPMHVIKRGNLKAYYPAHKLLAVTARATLALTSAALSNPADIIHIAKPHPMNSIAGLAGKLLRGRRLFLDCDDYEAGSTRFSGNWQRSGVTFFEKRIPHAVEAVTTNTRFMANNLVRWGIPEEMIKYLPNGVDRGRFAAPNPRLVDALKTKLGLIRKKVILYIGSLSLPSHPVDLLLDAFPTVLGAIPESYLLVVGGGEDYDLLRAQADRLGIQETTRFIGRVPPEDVPLYYALADVSVEPVHDDDAARGRSPLKLFESWACGTPFITADVGDRRALIGDPPAGQLTRPSDVGALAEAIIHVLSNPAEAQNMRDTGLNRVESYYWDKLVLRLESVYQQQIPRAEI
jgi:glycosyltransferase involved in cell wall biosynthesis